MSVIFKLFWILISFCSLCVKRVCWSDQLTLNCNIRRSRSNFPICLRKLREPAVRKDWIVNTNSLITSRKQPMKLISRVVTFNVSDKFAWDQFCNRQTILICSLLNWVCWLLVSLLLFKFFILHQFYVTMVFIE